MYLYGHIVDYIATFLLCSYIFWRFENVKCKIKFERQKSETRFWAVTELSKSDTIINVDILKIKSRSQKGNANDGKPDATQN